MAKRKLKVIPIPTYEVPAIEEGNGKLEVKKVVRESTITFESIPDRVICPHCKKLQFTVNQGPTNAVITRICDKCGTKTTYKFQILSLGVTTTSPLT